MDNKDIKTIDAKNYYKAYSDSIEVAYHSDEAKSNQKPSKKTNKKQKTKKKGNIYLIIT